VTVATDQALADAEDRILGLKAALQMAREQRDSLRGELAAMRTAVVDAADTAEKALARLQLMDSVVKAAIALLDPDAGDVKDLLRKAKAYVKATRDRV
jgi:hypothetical protein